MPEMAEELRATSDGLIRDLDVLAALEEQKRALAPGDAQLVDLAARVNEIAERVLSIASKQLRLAEVGQARIDAGLESAAQPSIEATPRPIAAILDEWRAAERSLAAAEPGSVEAAEAEALSAHLRDEYRRASDARIGN